MNDLNLRRQILNNAAALLESAEAPAGEYLYRLGQVYRVSCTDADASDEASALVDEADALLGKLQAASARWSLTDAQAPGLDAARAWLAAPRGHHDAVLSTLDRLGAMKAGATLVAEGSALGRDLDRAIDELTHGIARASSVSPDALYDLGVAALERVAAQGVVVSEDRAMLALDEVVQRRLTTALRGQPLPAPRTSVVRAIAADQAEALGKALAAAMQRSQPLWVAPELLELASMPGARSSRSFDLSLHNAAPSAQARQSVELMRGVQVTATDDEIEVELLGDESATVMLVPLRQGEPGQPCPCRTGNHPRHFVFSPAYDADLEGYALVVGDRLAFLKR